MESDESLFIQIAFLFILIALNAFFASSEIAIISLNDNKIKRMAEEGNKKAKLLHQLISNPSKFLATIQVGITLCGLLASAFASESFATKLAKIMASWGFNIDVSILKIISVFLVTLILSYFQLVLGELVPKRIAMNKPQEISMLAIKPLAFLSVITKPFVKVLTISTNIISRLFGIDPNSNEENITEEEIRMMVDVGQEKGVIQCDEKEMIDNIFNFDDTFVSEVMTHRIDMISLPIDATIDKVMDIAVNDEFTRIPIYEENVDHIIGILHIKDLLYYVKHKSHDDFDLRNIIREPYFVPDTKKTDELFRELQQSKTHMAIVIDEYGGTAGIVTIEDLLEEIVGNIFDEYDIVENEIEVIDDKTFVVDGSINIEKVEEILNVEIESEDCDTISGFIIEQLGRIPDKEEKPQIEYKDVIFKVLKLKNKRILKIEITMLKGNLIENQVS